MTRGAANMRHLADQIESIPDAAIAELVRWFVPRSEVIGGQMTLYGTRVQLSSKLRNPRKRERSTSVRIVGNPASAWSIKSFGRVGNYDIVPRRAQALKLGDVAAGAFIQHAHVDQPTHGDGRWDKLVDEADDRFPDVVATMVDRAVR